MRGVLKNTYYKYCIVTPSSSSNPERKYQADKTIGERQLFAGELRELFAGEGGRQQAIRGMGAVKRFLG